MQVKREIIELGDRINIDLKYGEEVENINITLTENTFNLETGEISIHSPIGNLINNKEIGYNDSTIINNVKVEVTINKRLEKQLKKDF